MADNRLGPTSAGAGTSHLGTITADLLEEERAGFIYNNDQEMLEANAVLEARIRVRVGFLILNQTRSLPKAEPYDRIGPRLDPG